jgi:hypothetical protein
LTGSLKAGAAFYCPKRAAVGDGKYNYKQDLWRLPPPATANKIEVSYLYRACDDTTNRWGIPAGERNQLNHLKLTGLKLKRVSGVWQSNDSRPATSLGPPVIALTMDLIGTRSSASPLADWPHANPFGACVGYSDGHGEWVIVPKQLALIPRTDPNFLNSADQAMIDGYVWQMFKAFDTKDFNDMFARTPGGI